ncbi:MAG: PA2778 family cysteine peptidase [Deltaproteobacteria bacterium]|nr:PA2778 family cysteine peptidase [Deltaproteobacteria bacterium]
MLTAKTAGMLLVVLLLALSGCAMPSRTAQPWPENAPDRVLLADVPFFPQEEYQCGPAALAMALGWSGIQAGPADLAGEVYTPSRQGSLQSSLIAAARRHGRVAYPIAGLDHLHAELSANHPVIVLVNRGLSWFPKWHYAVAVGYDGPAEEIILHSGKVQNDRLSLRVFNNIWARGEYWGLLVLPPGELPAIAEENAWIQAVAGLERTGQREASVTAYETARTKWPASFGAWLGLGNARYASGDMNGAAVAFERATRLFPESGPAFNNLAAALGKLGKRDEALTAARKAVELGGPLQEEFRQTINEIEASPCPSSPQ